MTTDTYTDDLMHSAIAFMEVHMTTPTPKQHNTFMLRGELCTRVSKKATNVVSDLTDDLGMPNPVCGLCPLKGPAVGTPWQGKGTDCERCLSDFSMVVALKYVPLLVMRGLSDADFC